MFGKSPELDGRIHVYHSRYTAQEPTRTEQPAAIRSSWPFPSIELSRYQALPADERDAIERVVRAMIIDAETRSDKRLASNGR